MNPFSKKSDPELEAFTVFDSKAGIYREPIFAINRHDIMRGYESTIRKYPDDVLVTNAEDFSLFKIGEYSKKTGQFVATHHEHIANLIDLRSAFMRSQTPTSGPTGIVST